MIMITNMKEVLWKTRKIGINNTAFKDGSDIRDFTEEDILEVDEFWFALFRCKVLIRSRAQQV